MVSQVLLHSHGHHSLLHGRSLGPINLAMPSPQRRLGQVALPEVRQSGQDLARECRFLHRNRRSNIGVAHASDLVEQTGCSSQTSSHNGDHHGWWRVSETSRLDFGTMWTDLTVSSVL